MTHFTGRLSEERNAAFAQLTPEQRARSLAATGTFKVTLTLNVEGDPDKALFTREQIEADVMAAVLDACRDFFWGHDHPGTLDTTDGIRKGLEWQATP